MLPSIPKYDSDYGRPPSGSKTEKRGLQAHDRISGEIVQLCQIIETVGSRNEQEEEGDCRQRVSYGRLFEIYVTISNKLVGLLLRARKYGLVDFPGEMLFQGRDDAVLITLIKQPTDNRLQLEYSSSSLNS